MAGIYIHIPFCKQACNYCNFHFTTSLKNKDNLIKAILYEIANRKELWQNESIETIYFGGGTPSLLSVSDMALILQNIYKSFYIDPHPEITLEANPDDLTATKLSGYKKLGINRLSIGIQSFHQEDLIKLNRSHTAQQAESAIKLAQDTGFNNITIDLIYGIPGLNHEKFKQNIEKVIAYHIPHVSAYALTVEPKTALSYQIKKGIFPKVSDEHAAEQFETLRTLLLKNGFLHYEISNFGKPEYISIHNRNYWNNKAYIGLGPAAHSYYQNKRRWNIANNALYIKKMGTKAYYETENLSLKDIYNESIMTGLRTIWGVDLKRIKTLGKIYYDKLIADSQKYVKRKQLYVSGNHLIADYQSWFIIEGIISDLFWI